MKANSLKEFLKGADLGQISKLMDSRLNSVYMHLTDALSFDSVPEIQTHVLQARIEVAELEQIIDQRDEKLRKALEMYIDWEDA